MVTHNGKAKENKPYPSGFYKSGFPKKTKVTLNVDKEALDIIDRGRKKEFSSRSNFLVRAAVNHAKNLIRSEK